MWDRAVSTDMLFMLSMRNCTWSWGFCVYFPCYGRTYKPLLKDVGAYLALYWVPTRADGKCGEPLISICSTPVSPGISMVFCWKFIIHCLMIAFHHMVWKLFCCGWCAQLGTYTSNVGCAHCNLCVSGYLCMW